MTLQRPRGISAASSDTYPLRDVKASPGRQGRLSAHFVADELACPHCEACIVTAELIVLLERIRSHIGGPLRVVSGYRCPIHNMQIGGTANSEHMYGRAADVPAGVVPLAVAVHAGAKGIGIRGHDVVHVDVRPGPRAIFPDPA